jgi:PPK2 family polyphosphate:nucleotide phosphotransferase
LSARTSVRDLLRVDPDGGAILPGIDPAGTPGVKDREAAEAERPRLSERLHGLQERLFVEGRRSVLVVLQAMDTGGKDGTIEHVFGTMNPAGVEVAAFKKPTEEELAHHFLWRIERRLPLPGQIMIFNRSHYEDVLVVRVHGLVPEDVWRGRFDEIDDFEARVSSAGTTIVKCFLHISYDEQRERFLRRLRRRDKWWKFAEADIDTRARWPEWEVVYGKAIGRTSTEVAPWYAIPADHKWHRNWAIATLLVEHFEALGEDYPELDTDADIETLRARLAPPN